MFTYIRDERIVSGCQYKYWQLFHYKREYYNVKYKKGCDNHMGISSNIDEVISYLKCKQKKDIKL